MPTPSEVTLAKFTDNFGEPVSLPVVPGSKYPLLLKAEAQAKVNVKEKVMVLWQLPPIRRIVTRDGYVFVPSPVYRSTPDPFGPGANLFKL